jgi:type I restriction enzyme S subunit
MGNEYNIPKLRFPEFSGEWKEKKVGDVFSIFNGYAFPSNESVENGVLWVKIADVGIQEMKKDNLSFLPLEFKEKHSKFLLKKGDYVVALTRPILSGKLKIAQIDDYFDSSLLNQRVGKIESQNSKGFIFCYLQKDELIKSIENNIAGSDPPNLSTSEINSIELVIPSLPEQQKIASFLSAVDEKLQALKKKKSLLEQYKKGVMQKIFSQEIRFKDTSTSLSASDGSGFPEWEVKKLGEIFNSEKGKGISKNKVVDDGKYECVLYGELYTRYKEVIFEIVSKTNEIDGTNSKKGDLLIPSSTTTTGIDLANVTALNKDNVLLGGDITILRSTEKINNVFYAYYLSNYKKEEIASYAQGSTIVHLYYSHIKDMIIDLPSFHEQTKIANFLSAIDEKINLVNGQVEKMEVWKKGLLQKMFV